MTQPERERYLEEMLTNPTDADQRAEQAAVTTGDPAAVQTEADEQAQGQAEDQAAEAIARGDVESSDRVIRREQVIVNPDTGERIVEEQTLIVPSFDRVQEARIARAQRVIYYIARFITIFLLLQFALRLFGANPETPIAGFIFAVSAPFYFPFRDLFGRGDFATYRYVFDAEALFAITIYWLFAYLGAKGVAVFIRRSAARDAIIE
jgi:hypothetical protein